MEKCEKTKNIKENKPEKGKKNGYNVYSPTPDEILIFTVKATTKNATTLSKFFAELRRKYKPLLTSRILYNRAKKEYFAYINFLDAEVAEQLAEISAFPFSLEVKK